MYSMLAITSAMLLMGEACFQDRQARPHNNSTADTSSWRTYTNPQFGFGFRYPSHWREANTFTDKANVIWINFYSSSAGAARNVLYVKVFTDPHAFSIEERLIAGNATATQVMVDKTTQNLYGDFRIPTVMISKNDVLVEIGDPSDEGYLRQILATLRLSK